MVKIIISQASWIIAGHNVVALVFLPGCLTLSHLLTFSTYTFLSDWRLIWINKRQGHPESVMSIMLIWITLLFLAIPTNHNRHTSSAPESGNTMICRLSPGQATLGWPGWVAVCRRLEKSYLESVPRSASSQKETFSVYHGLVRAACLLTYINDWLHRLVYYLTDYPHSNKACEWGDIEDLYSKGERILFSPQFSQFQWLGLSKQTTWQPETI